MHFCFCSFVLFLHYRSIIDDSETRFPEIQDRTEFGNRNFNRVGRMDLYPLIKISISKFSLACDLPEPCFKIVNYRSVV